MKIFKNIIYAFIALNLASLSGMAGAEPFYIVLPPGYATASGDADTQTATIDELGISFQATSTYFDNDSSYDGSNASTFVTVGDTVIDSGSGNVSSLILGGVGVTGNNNTEGLGTTWQLSFDYSDLVGQVVVVDNSTPGTQGVGSFYFSGTINIYLDALDPNTGLPTSSDLVMQLQVYGSSGTVGNAVIYTYVDFTNVDPALADGMFFFADGSDFYDQWLADGPISISLTARIDTNVDPQLVPTCDNATCDTASRSNTLNGGVQFIPEPASLALLGAGLVLLSASRRRLKK